MKTVILVGGLGMRLRPLTNHTAKPMIPVVNRPFIEYLIELLKRHGLREVILSSYYLPESIRGYFGDGSRFGVSIEYCIEQKPLGTAGAVKNCEPLLNGETFIMFNGDILTDLDLTALVNFHKENGAIATVSLGKVIDPTTYGMIDVAKGRAIRWYEKPSWNEATSRWVNLGACVLEPEVLQTIPPGEQVSIERETFPSLISSRKPIFAFQSLAYWLDIGTPPKYLKAQRNILSGVVQTHILGNRCDGDCWIGEGSHVAPGASLKGPIVIGDNSEIAAGAIIIGPTVIGNNVQVGREAFIEESAIWDNCVLENEASLTGTILGKQVTLKRGATLKEGCVVEDKYVVLPDRVYSGDSILGHEQS